VTLPQIGLWLHRVQACSQDSIDLLPEFGQCPWQGPALAAVDLPISFAGKHFHSVAGTHLWQPDCEYKLRSSSSLQGVGMLGELTNIPTDTLIDMLYMILAGEVAITANDAAEIEQIQRELQRRDGAQNWSFATIH
jgi:hypothetical protein